MENRPNLCKCSCHKVALEFFATNAHDPPHWTLNSCFGVFRTIWVHLVSFGYLTKLGAKWAEVVQKFVPRSRIRIFRNERTRSTPLDSKLTFGCVSHYSGAFGTLWLAYKTQCKTGRSGAKVRAMKSCRNFSQQTTRSTPLDSKLMFWCVSFYLGAFGIVWLPYKTWCKMGRTSAKVRATKSRQNFFLWNAPDPPHWTLT